MPEKKKKTVWHKRREKFVPSSAAKPHHPSLKSANISGPTKYTKKQMEKIKAFKQDLRAKIKDVLDDDRS